MEGGAKCHDLKLQCFLYIVRKVYLDDLPHRGNLICWNKSIGYDIAFEYEDIKGSMKIIGVNNEKKSVVLEYLGDKYTITTSRLIQNGISKILGVNYGRRKNKYSVGEVVNNKKILDITYENKKKRYKFECLNCNQVNIQQEYNFENCGCPVCNQSRVVVPHINGIKGLYPDVYKIRI